MLRGSVNVAYLYKMAPHPHSIPFSLQISELQGEALKRDKEVRAKALQQQKEHASELESLQVSH